MPHAKRIGISYVFAATPTSMAGVKSLGCTAVELRAAVRAAGTGTDAVHAHLKK